MVRRQTRTRDCISMVRKISLDMIMTLVDYYYYYYYLSDILSLHSLEILSSFCSQWKHYSSSVTSWYRLHVSVDGQCLCCCCDLVGQLQYPDQNFTKEAIILQFKHRIILTNKVWNCLVWYKLHYLKTNQAQMRVTIGNSVSISPVRGRGCSWLFMQMHNHQRRQKVKDEVLSILLLTNEITPKKEPEKISFPYKKFAFAFLSLCNLNSVICKHPLLDLQQHR